MWLTISMKSFHLMLGEVGYVWIYFTDSLIDIFLSLWYKQYTWSKNSKTYQVFWNAVYTFNTLKLIGTSQKSQISIIPHDTAAQMSNSHQWFLTSPCYYWVSRASYPTMFILFKLWPASCFPNDHPCPTQYFFFCFSLGPWLIVN